MVDWVLFLFGFSVIFDMFFYVFNYVKTLIFKSDLSVYGAGSWVIITGSTDGIGKSYAYSLAKKGFNIISISRNPEKLAELSSDLKSKYGIKVLNLARDFSLGSSDPVKFYSDIYTQTKGLDVSIVVNNVGAFDLNLFLKQNRAVVLNQLALNIFSVVFLTRFYLPDLSNRKKALVINISSISAEYSLKEFSVYAATKSFEKVFSNILANECKIDVLCSQPGFVRTKFIKDVEKTPFCIESDLCSEYTLRAAGITSSTPGHWQHFLVLNYLKLLHLIS